VPDVPPLPGPEELTGPAASLADRVSEVFAPGGVLASEIPDFEPRAGQLTMALAVASVLEHGGTLLAEAGTGTGKTIAYLVPAILSRQRVVISTGTKNLQEQIFFKDIPVLERALEVPFTAAYMKGRANYLCLHRLDQLTGEALTPRNITPGRRTGRLAPERTEEASRSIFLPIIKEWAADTKTGDRAELEDLPEDLPFWSAVAATAETCLGTDCARYDDCFVTQMRQQAAAADIVVVNHHLLCADAAVRQSAFGEVIPPCTQLIIDEAHQFEDIATQYFGVAASTFRIDDLIRDVERSEGLLNGASSVLTTIKASEGLHVVRAANHEFFGAVATTHRTGREDRVRVTPATVQLLQEPASRLAGALDLLARALEARAAASEDQDAAVLARRTSELRDDVRFLARACDPKYVYFAEFRGQGVFLRALPIDVSTIVRDSVLDAMRSTVLTSATLTVDTRFDYIRERLGIGEAEEIRLPSEFDYTRQARLYLPKDMPDPRSPDFAHAAGRQVIEILRRTEGRAFVLFTSYATLRAVHDLVELQLEYPLLVQGTAPRRRLIEQFRSTPHAVLFATSSFWQGVDVVGDALSCVIVDKLPFASPSEPVTAARIDAIRARGGEPFSDYQVPLAVLALQQGLGRLIRHRQDRGVLAVLDPRLHSKGYGRRFLMSLPPAPIVRELRDLERFLDQQ
jgi:ATP-dependent DNA helicase DinG